MKRKYILAVLAVTCTIFAAGCGAKADVPQNTAQTESNDNSGSTDSADSADVDDKSDGTDSADSTVSGDQAEADDKTQTDNTDTEQTVTGTIDEIKDFMFIVTDDSGNSYEFSFETKPDGLDNVQAGDKVKVTYTGELSEVDAFTGKIISVEKQ